MVARNRASPCMGIPLAFFLLLGCDKGKDVAPKLEPASTPTETASKEQAEEEGTKRIQALPPEQAFAAQGATSATVTAAPAKIGYCAFEENSYDGQDTRSQEKMVVKIRDGRIVHVLYRYRGSYALDGTAEPNLPVREGAWQPLEFPLTSGTGKFKVKLDGNSMLFKGTAADTPQGDCRWEEAEPEK
jgi:major membrane immunogen (membrane-anchored lipoprotein)